jgi:hypothetical protein
LFRGQKKVILTASTSVLDPASREMMTNFAVATSAHAPLITPLCLFFIPSPLLPPRGLISPTHVFSAHVPVHVERFGLEIRCPSQV